MPEEELGRSHDSKHTPRTIPTPASRRRRRRPKDAPKTPNEKCLTNCQYVGYAKKREKEGRNERRRKSKKDKVEILKLC